MKGAVLAVSMLLLSGCSDGGGKGPDDDLDDTADDLPLVGGNETDVEPIVVTQTLHLLEAPGVSLILPAQAEPDESAFETMPGSESPGTLWDYVLTANATFIDVTGTIWVRLESTVVTGAGGTVCPFNLGIEVYTQPENPDGSGNHITGGGCAGSGPTMEAGDHQLEFGPIRFLNGENGVELAAGSRLEIHLSPITLVAPPDSVTVLGGTPDFSSWVEIEGMAEPVPADP